MENNEYDHSNYRCKMLTVGTGHARTFGAQVMRQRSVPTQTDAGVEFAAVGALRWLRLLWLVGGLVRGHVLHLQLLHALHSIPVGHVESDGAGGQSECGRGGAGHQRLKVGVVAADATSGRRQVDRTAIALVACGGGQDRRD